MNQPTHAADETMTARGRRDAEYDDQATARGRREAGYDDQATATDRREAGYDDYATTEDRRETEYDDQATARGRREAGYDDHATTTDRRETEFDDPDRVSGRAEDYVEERTDVMDGPTEELTRAQRMREVDDEPARAPSDGNLGPGQAPNDPVAALWGADLVERYRIQWRELQLTFVDDPQRATGAAASLVDDAVASLTNTLLAQKQALDGWQSTRGDDTEVMRVALRNYRDFLDRLLGL
jgi:hypothetical protein